MNLYEVTDTDGDYYLVGARSAHEARGLVIDYLASVELLPGVTVGYEGAEHLREGLRYTYVASKTGQDLLGGCDPAGEVLYRSRWF